MTRMTGPDCAIMCNLIIHIHTEQCEWHRMARITGPDCVFMCNLINIHTYIHTYILLTQCYYHRGTRLNAMKSFVLTAY